MIDTKIACQCGNRFKFGMDLVNGRAPDGLVCPTCGADATPACNVLVDFLAGKEPPPIGVGTRPLKEVRVVCACGARYKFDLELAEQEMPAAVTCPACQVDLTPTANEAIRSYIAKHPLNAESPAPAPTAASVPPPAAPAPAAPAAPAPAVASTEPPPAAPAAAPATPAPSATPVTDPFGPPPTSGKSSGPNLKPLDVPKPNRPPPGSRPASPPAKPATPGSGAAGAAKPAAPAAAKPQPAKAAEKPSAAGAPKLGLGVAGAAAGALVGGGIWFAIVQFTPLYAGWMASVVGSLAGAGARALGRRPSPQLGGAACVFAVLVIGLMVWQVMMRHIDLQLAPQLKSQYDSALGNAKAAANATDAELKVIIARTLPNADLDGAARVTDQMISEFKTKQLPALRDLAAGKPSRAEWEAQKRGALRAYYPIEDAWQESIGIFGLLWAVAGVFAAAKIALK